MSGSDDQNIMGAMPDKLVKREGDVEVPQGNKVPGSSVDRADLSILLKITKSNGESQPFGTVNEQLVEEIFQNALGIIPLEIIIVNDQNVLVDFLAETAIFDVARAIHGEGRQRDQNIWIGCLMSTREHLVIIEREREEIRTQRGELEHMRSELWAKEQESKAELDEKTLQAKGEFAVYRTQMNDLTKRVNEQLDLLEVVRRTTEQEMLH